MQNSMQYPRMTESDIDRLQTLLGDVPRGLLSYFDAISDGTFSGCFQREINLLPLQDSLRVTESLIDQPVIQSLGGLVLDDANTSNFHVYLTSPALKGFILYLSHDGDTRAVYASIEDFLAAARSALTQSSFSWEDEHPKAAPLAIDQKALSQLVVTALEEDDSSTLTALIPCMDLSDIPLLRRLAVDADFYFGEAVAEAVRLRPSLELLEIAELCISHKHPQVSDVGRKARSAIDQASAI